MSNPRLVEEKYFLNATTFLTYRTGHVPNLSRQAFDQMLNATGLAFINHHGILLILMRSYTTLMEKSSNMKNALERMFKMITKNGKHGIVEIIASIMELNSVKIRDRIGSYLMNFSNICNEYCPRTPHYLSATYLFALSPLMRPSFGTRPDFRENLIKNNMADRCISTLNVRILTPDEYRPYESLYSLKALVPIAEDDILCIWNGFKIGNIIYTENLGINALNPITIHRVVPHQQNASKLKSDMAEADD